MSGAQPGQLGTGIGIGGSVFSNGWPGFRNASVPAATIAPEGPQTITQAAWGAPATGGAAPNIGSRAALISTVALVLLAVFWWTLPK
jgi:hypothetical protein